MKKELLLCLIASTVLLGCNNSKDSSESTSSPSNTTESSVELSQNSTGNSNVESSLEISSESESSLESSSDIELPPSIDTYTVVNSSNDLVYVYGVVGETFDLRSIDSSRCTKNELKYELDGDCASLNGTMLSFNEVGTATVVVKTGNRRLYAVQISVNKDENSRYAYPYELDLTSFTQHSGTKNNVKINDDSITLTSDGSAWNRITYELDETYAKNYTIECDATFLNTSDNTRWLGIVFRDNETNSNKYPYYQFDFRKDTSASNAVEVTYVYNNGAYSYPYIGTWKDGNPGLLSMNDPVHVKLDVRNNSVSGSLSCKGYTTQVNAILPTSVAGNIGFQCAGSTVKFENIKLSLDKNTIKTSNANTENSKVNMEDGAFDALKPNMIASGGCIDELFGVNVYGQEYFAKVEDTKLYNINGELMEENLNEVLLSLLGLYIPNLQIEDEDTLNTVSEICESFGVVDITIWSTNGDILDKAISKMPYARTGYIPTNVKSFETFDEIADICHEAGRHFANLILLDSELLNKENIIKVTGLGYSVVANAKNGDNYSVINSALTGCKLILANYNKNVQTQTNLIYDDDVFNVEIGTYSSTHSLLSVPYATGHRGAGTNGSNPSIVLPENTIESYKWAFENGAQAIEIDIHTTSDNRLAVIHDGETGNYSNVNLVVKNSTLEKLQSIPLRFGGTLSYQYHIPSLEEVFEAFSGEEYKDKAMVIEVKDNLVSTGKKALEMAKEMGWYNKITFITFNAATALELRKYDPAIQVGYLNTVTRHSNEEYWISNSSYLSLGVGLASQFTTISGEPLQESNARGQMYWLWTFNTNDSSALVQHILDGNRAFTTNVMSFFTNNKYMLEFTDSISLANNETKALTATSITYKGTKTEESNVEIIVLSDNAKANKNEITRTGDGDIYVVLKHKTSWNVGTASTNFYIYSDVVVIK